MILEFKDEFAFLSNFFLCPVRVLDRVFPSSEHAFMSFKNDSEEWKAKCMDPNITPGQIKRLARKIELIEDWNDFRLTAMKTVVSNKFWGNKELRAKLLATGDQNLVEGNRWGDRFFGVDLTVNPNIGENHLGRILMQVRCELRM